MHSADSNLLDASERRTLLELARASIEHGLTHGRPSEVEPSRFPANLQVERAAFVTLEARGQLRGCIGHLQAVQPLVRDVAENAFAAAFRDPRFPPLQRSELSDLDIEISVLTPAEPMTFTSETDLLERIEPGRDGLIIIDGASRGTFLPTVWESLPDPRDFLRNLKLKAGLGPDHWSESLEVWRYRTEAFSE